MRKTRSFDCVALKRKGALSIYEDVKDMDFEQKVAYWREQNRKFDEFRNQAPSGTPDDAGEDIENG